MQRLRLARRDADAHEFLHRDALVMPLQCDTLCSVSLRRDVTAERLLPEREGDATRSGDATLARWRYRSMSMSMSMYM